ncbi:MAG: recombinase family protein [Thermoplasmata archaeon]|nr:recombinase family protein [Thermoplasmata archaeon]
MQEELENSQDRITNDVTNPIICAIYARVSTRDSKQDVGNQLYQLREYCKKSNYQIFNEYIDHKTGKSGDRPEFKRLFKDVHQKKFDIVLFWALDRFSREGARETLNYLNQLEFCGVKFRSLTEPYFDSVGIFQDALISILATLAKQERIRISERTIAGLERAKKRGKSLGPPELPNEVIEKVQDYLDQGKSYRYIQKNVKFRDKKGKMKHVSLGSIYYIKYPHKKLCSKKGSKNLQNVKRSD